MAEEKHKTSSRRKEIPLPRSALWRVIQTLSPAERRRIWARIEGTRLEWLFRTLEEMSDFSQEELRTRFEQAFPDKDERLLGVYKRQLWDVIEEMLPTRQVPEIAEEVRLWQRI